MNTGQDEKNNRHFSLSLLRQSLATLKETEESGKDTLQTLAVQREKIQQVNKNREDTESELNKSNSLLRKMLSYFRG